MNKTTIALASAILLGLGAQSAQAQQTGQYALDPITITNHVTRAQVRADVWAAQATGTLYVTDTSRHYTQTVPATHISRAQSEAQALQARVDGTLMVTDYNTRPVTAVRSSTTRQSVRSETLANANALENNYFQY